jgi:hypothetical protein
MVAGFVSECRPASNRYGGRHQIGIPGRLKSEFAIEEALWREGAEPAYAGERTMRGVGYAKKARVRGGVAMDMEVLDLQGRAGED